MKTTRRILSIVFIFLSTTSFAQDWSSLDSYQETMSREEAETLFNELLIGNDAEEYINQHFQFTENTLRVQDADGNLEYEFRFGTQAFQSKLKWNGQNFNGLKFALVARDKGSITVAQSLKNRLVEKGAQGNDVKVQTNKDEAMASINKAMNAFKPHVTLVIQDAGVGISFIAFAPGAFRNGELNREDQRFKLLHSLVTRKTLQSVDFSRHLVKNFIEGGTLKKKVRADDYEGNIRQVPTVDGSEMEYNMAVRNLFINGVWAPVVVWAFTGSAKAYLGTDTKKIASHYLNSIEEYVHTFEVVRQKDL